MTEESHTPAEPSQVSTEQQTWRVLAHASALIQFLGPPSVVGPLVVWLLRRNDPVVEPHARAALNYQLTLLIYFIVGGIAAVVLFFTIIGIPFSILIVVFLLLLVVLEVVFAILATLAASRGEVYDYPMSLGLIK
ncbi:MAG: DUF4870 domain-containing protein [Actinobacteria bacterium]|nr:DUF4870 domain-containing protein [Actinomycetota bacterium]